MISIFTERAFLDELQKISMRMPSIKAAVAAPRIQPKPFVRSMNQNVQHATTAKHTSSIITPTHTSGAHPALPGSGPALPKPMTTPKL